LDATLVPPVAQTPPAAIHLDTATATSTPAGEQEAAADAYFVALAREDLNVVLPHRRDENLDVMNALLPVGSQDEDLAGLAAELVAVPTEA
jgi:hypothetical protein